MPEFKLEPEFEPAFQTWKQTPSTATAGSLLQQLDPVIGRGIQAYAGQNTSPLLRSHARKITLKAIRTYDPMRAKLSTHVLNHLQGLKRIQRNSAQIGHIPERISLDRIRLDEAEAQLDDEYGRPPSTAELADYTGLSRRRIERVRSIKMPIAEGQLSARMDASGEMAGFAPAVKQEQPSSVWLNILYDDMGPTDQHIMEWTLGLNGQPVLPNQEIARRLGKTPGAISQRKAKIQATVDRFLDVNSF